MTTDNIIPLRQGLYQDTAAALASIRSTSGHPYEFWLRIGFSVVGVMPDAEGPGKPSIQLAKRIVA